MNRLNLKSAITTDEAGTVEGIAWPFGSADTVGDIIEPGAFVGAPLPVPMYFGHSADELIGEWDSVVETERGLEVKGRLFLDQSARARKVYDALRRGNLKGLSVGFNHPVYQPRAGRGRIIRSLDLAEISIVRAPAHPGASVTNLKSADAARMGFAVAFIRAASALSLKEAK